MRCANAASAWCLPPHPPPPRPPSEPVCRTCRTQVESTLSRSALRAGGTLAGGVLGLWVMLLQGWAQSPVGLLAVVTLVAFLVGAYGRGEGGGKSCALAAVD
jgi:hypothetical protein